MLVLSRRKGEVVEIENDQGEKIRLMVTHTDRCKTRIGIEAPNNYKIKRQELGTKPATVKSPQA